MKSSFDFKDDDKRAQVRERIVKHRLRITHALVDVFNNRKVMQIVRKVFALIVDDGVAWKHIIWPCLQIRVCIQQTKCNIKVVIDNHVRDMTNKCAPLEIVDDKCQPLGSGWGFADY